MATVTKSRLGAVLAENDDAVLEQWVKAQMNAKGARPDLINPEEVRENSRRFLQGLVRAIQGDGGADPMGAAFEPTRSVLGEVARSRAKLGFSPAETATFVFSLKEPLFGLIRKEFSAEPKVLADETWAATTLLDRLGLYTTELHQKSREEVIARQQQDLLEISTPVVKLWEGVLALPLIGTLDSSRTQVIMEALLQEIVRTGAGLAIIDITGVPTVDTLVAQHLLKTVAAARLMGADCIISGIRPQIAQTIVHLGVDLQDVITKASLADAFAVALTRLGLRVTKAGSGKAGQGRAEQRGAAGEDHQGNGVHSTTTRAEG